MKVLITGGAGYIGSILTPQLLKLGHEVTVIDNFYYGQSSLLDCCNDTKLKVVRGDARNATLVKENLDGQDFIIPLACLVGAPLCEQKPLEAKSINHDAVKMLLDIRKPHQKIIFPTTNSGYGIGLSNQYCTEETAMNPISLYGRLKVDIETTLLNSENTLTLRLATVFGMSPRMRLDLLVNDFTYRAVTDRFVVLFESHFKRNYIHVRDVAKAFIHCMDNFSEMKGQPYNVGLSDANLSKFELCEKIREKIPGFVFMESEVGQDPDKRNYIVSNEKIEKTGFRPDYGIESGITELIKGYQVIRRNAFSNI